MIPPEDQKDDQEPAVDRISEQSCRIMARAQREADSILEKARAILDEAKTVEGSFQHGIEDRHAEAREIGFDEGFRVGRAQGKESGRIEAAKVVLSSDSSEAVVILEEAARRLKSALVHFESDRRRYLEGLRKVVHRISEQEGVAEADLPDVLLEFLEEDPPRADLRPEDQVWLEEPPPRSLPLEPSLASASESSRADRNRRRSARPSRRGKGPKRGSKRST